MIRKTRPLCDGGTLGLIQAGSGDPVVLIHGVGLRAEAWEPQITALAATHRVIALDMPGHGASSPLPSGALLSDYVCWAARAIGGLGMGPVSLAGHSMGALIAGGMAVDHPGLVARVALLSPVHRRSEAARAAVLARASAIAAGGAGVDAPLARWFDDDQQALHDRVAGWLKGVDRQGYAAAYRAFATGDATYADRLGEIACPALILTGESDANSSPEMTRAIAAACRGRAVVVPGQRHMVNLTAPRLVNEALRDWLALKRVIA